ncbi:hypothetical protein GCM10009122_12340 [Fulvivirga kasyanovii]|uniref:Uncharacterized protein n=1 Tax=Fulvivirga kasyanovii TaxID=396812 RepID=A0ABW9RL23_9BACT|nr:pinensin family lanthipeptide [Fulvivirga kasyanovii]MTI24676.1 hypothetical protein [Fulvivirga kasyanovii]
MSKKLKLEELKLESFVTSMESEKALTVQGGHTPVVLTIEIVSALGACIGDEKPPVYGEHYTEVIVDMGTGDACLVP